MKALKEMNNLEKGELLCKLFPEELENLQNAIEGQCEYFLRNEVEFRKRWIRNAVMTDGLWYDLVRNAHERILKYKNKLYKRSRWFSDQFFDGYNVLLTVHCLIEYTQQEHCDPKLKQAIRLFFGVERVLKINYEED